MAHRIEIKVRGYHCDHFGHVNNARYIELLEEARWSLFEEQAAPNFFEQEGGAVFVVVNINVNYRRPAVLRDVLRIESGVCRVGRSSGVVRQEVFNQRGEPVADAEVTFALFDPATARSRPLSPTMRQTLERMRDERGGPAGAGAT